VGKHNGLKKGEKMKPDIRKIGLEAAGVKPQDFCPICWAKVKRIVDRLGEKVLEEKKEGK